MRLRLCVLVWIALLAAVEARNPGSKPPAQVPAAAGASRLYGSAPLEVALVQTSSELKGGVNGRSLPYRVTYPKNGAGLPVIIWSHGMYGSQDNYRPLVEHWARHGYLVVQPSHRDSLTCGEGKLSDGFSKTTQNWNERPREIRLLLDRLSKDPVLSRVGDWSRVGMGGHSFGAHTTQLVAGARPRLGGDLSDPRPRAFVAISPQGESPLFPKGSWDGMTRPMLFVSGDNDESPQGQPASWRLDPFQQCPSGQKYLLWVKNAYHNFGGISGAARRNASRVPEQVEVVKAATLAFWDRYLKSSPQAGGVLTSGKLGGSSDALYTWTVR